MLKMFCYLFFYLFLSTLKTSCSDGTKCSTIIQDNVNVENPQFSEETKVEFYNRFNKRIIDLDAREAKVRKREEAALSREEDLDARETKVRKREEAAQSRQEDLDAREAKVKKREEDLNAKE
ncbi:hypothetical protein EDEG_01371 [Edhazardia aedis USNM 41457]|uniref:Uncharacterized protein n=1 Tax=Edhazardia aedis (strain USNM 41457) TaxID=1003232 RepID=J9D9D6_EDHAE|nr:hypothetical protein EDEG_01371 [Edhazardia aedis USNM 41457]|eukprot:EJW04391.1 hypothetical protein EDEG_01371 [Edhazardia aedis USNM 41457]